MSKIRLKTQSLDNSLDKAKLEADFLNGGNLDLTNGNNDATITGLKAGTTTYDAVNYGQLTALINGLHWQQSVKLLASGDVTLSGSQTIDGVATSDGDRIGCFSQATSTQDGIYIADSGAWTRASDFATGDDVASYTFMVEEGTTYADTQWTITNNSGSATVGTDDLLVSQIGATTTYIGGAGIDVTGTTIAVDLDANSGLEFNANKLSVDIGNTNGSSLEISATGVELLATITGARTFNTGAGLNFTVNADVNRALLGNAPDGSVDLAIATVGYAKSIAELTKVNETTALGIAGQTATLSTAPTTGVTKLRVYLNGNRLVEGAGNEYQITNATTGEITMTANQTIVAGDVITMDYVDA